MTRRFGHSPHLVVKSVRGEQQITVSYAAEPRRGEAKTEIDTVPLTAAEAVLPLAQLRNFYASKSLKYQRTDVPETKAVKEKTTIAPRAAYMAKNPNTDGSMGRLDIYGGPCPSPRGSALAAQL